MSDALTTTFRVLAETDNKAATGVLVPALDSPRPRIQDEALRTILRRRSSDGCREVLRRLHLAPREWRTILAEYQGRMTAPLRDAVLSADSRTCENACQAILWFGEYDLIPVLLTAAEDSSNPNGALATQTVLELAELLYQEIAAPRDYKKRRDPQILRQHAVASLDLSLQRYPQHQKRDLVEAYMLLTNRDSSTLKQTLNDSNNASHSMVTSIFKKSARPGVLRLVLSFLDDPYASPSTLRLLSERTDYSFLQHLTRKMSLEPSATVVRNVKRITQFSFMRENMEILDSLDEEQQHGVVQLLHLSGVRRLSVFQVLRHLLQHGKAEGRRAAIAALEEYNGGSANELVLAAIDDEDAEVQATALSQLRPRGIPGAMSRLLSRIESPHASVQEAVRQSLKEFNFERYLGAFDMMEDKVRQSTGTLVRKLDPTTVPRLEQELGVPSRTRRLRAIDIATMIDVVSELESTLIELTECDDHMVRAESARALGSSYSPETMAALRESLNDSSVTVRDAAQRGLEELLEAKAQDPSP